MDKKSSVGKRIRQMREDQHLSIEQLAEKSNTHKKYIEELESDKLTPSIAPLLKIARGLGVQISTLLDDAPTQEEVVTRVDLPETEIGFSVLSPYGATPLEFHPLAKNQKGRHMEPFIIDVYPSTSENLTFSRHDGEEFIYVLEGEVEVLYGDRRHVLSVGNSIYYNSTRPHQVRSAGDKKARILAVMYT